MPAGSHYLTATQAADALGVTRATLYAYASRGQLRSEAIPGRPRERRYYREDLERLQQRKEARRDPNAAAARGLHWGGPVLDSGLTLIHDGRFYYRGRDAVQLAGTASVEHVAALLWAADDTEREQLFEQPCALSPRQLAQLRTCTKDPFTRLQIALCVAAALDAASCDLRPAAVRQTAARIIRLLTKVITRHGRRRREPLHRALQAAWAPKTDGVGDVIRTALVLCADHELNVSAFTARCAASAGASPYDVVSAAMATLKGYKHGGAADRVLSLLAGSGTPKRARAVVANGLRRGEHLPGFGHPLYPAGDPRAVLLLRLAQATGNEVEWRPIRNLWRAGSELLNEFPNLDFGLAAVTRTYLLPHEAPLLLFALGRTIGWMAHAIEEYASGQLIRPRARYTGPVPEASRA
ncbi:MAG: citrate synthase [Acidobacteria bacterium]|nr:MAG: citrate synthase [Acidobacteriota bacterium]